jgi:hypothetical protein
VKDEKVWDAEVKKVFFAEQNKKKFFFRLLFDLGRKVEIEKDFIRVGDTLYLLLSIAKLRTHAVSTLSNLVMVVCTYLPHLRQTFIHTFIHTLVTLK